jgi:energy-coupling factor transporter ATP-binding protein EcfA2
LKLKQIEIIKYRNFENVIIDFEKTDFPSVFSIASKNGGGKSTLLQFVFILLHSFMDNNRKIYLKNILNEFSNVIDEIELVKFTIEADEHVYTLDFSIINTGFKSDFNFNLYLDLDDTNKKIVQYQTNMEEHKQILELKNELENNERITPIIERNMRHIQRYINTMREQEQYREAIKSSDILQFRKLVSTVISKNLITENMLEELESIQETVKNDLNALENILNKLNKIYITHLHENVNVLILQTKMPKKLLIELTNKIFLTAPSSQVFLFLSEEEKHNIFNELSNVVPGYKGNISYAPYYESVRRAKQRLPGFYTYDFASTELILQSFRKANEEDSRTMRKTGKYGKKYNDLTEELRDFLDGKEISENEEGNRVIFKSTHDKRELSPEDLSHGELKKLGIYIWLKYIVSEDSIILMDEIDIALHPKWQYQLVNDLFKWSKNSQFLLATHSPQILSSTYYKNIIKLDKGKVYRYVKPPLDRDINSIIIQIMEAPDFPENLKELHVKYRKLINDGHVNTDEAILLKAQILEYESENSKFFQDINFDLELM